MTKARCWKHRAFSKSVRAYLSGPPFVEGLTQLRVPLQALDGRRNRETPVTTAIQTAILNTFRAGQISRTAKDVLLIIARSIRPASYESLAKAAKCSRRSVAYAIQQAEQLGILRRSHNRIRRGRRWMNGCNGYRFIMKALTETLAFPWSRSQCKPCSTSNEDKKNTGWMPHSPDEYRLILERMAAGLTPEEAGYRGSLT